MMGLATGMHVAMGQNQPMMMAAPPQGPNSVNQGQGGVSPHPKPKVMCSHPGCGKEFAWQQDLAKHVRRYHSDEPPRFACTHDGCEKKFYERKLLVAHERTHTDERPFACKYPGCGKAFRARNALAYHHKALHESGVVLRCTEDGCRFTTRKAEALATHKLRHQQRAAAKVWKQQKKGEVQAAVKTAKEELRTKSAELVNTQKQLAQEQKAHAKALKELNALRATHAKMKRKVSSSATELETLRSQKRARGGAGGKDVPGDGRGGKGGNKAGAQGGGGLNGGAERNVPAIMPEIVLLDGPTGKMPMLAMDAPAALAAAAAAARARQFASDGGDGVGPPGTVTVVGAAGGVGMAPPPPLATTLNVNGTMRRLQPVCAQALPWSTSFIGCPGVKCDEGHDFTQLFLEDGSRNAGNRRTTPLEVDHPKDVAAFHARSTNCPWAKPNLQVTLERASDPMALHALLDEIAPKKALKVKRVDGQCGACYAAHVALAARLRAKHQAKTAEEQEPVADEVDALVGVLGDGDEDVVDGDVVDDLDDGLGVDSDEDDEPVAQRPRRGV